MTATARGQVRTPQPEPAAARHPAPTGVAELATAIAGAVAEVPGVAGLVPGGPVEVATLYPGGKVTGVRLGGEVEVCVHLDRLPIGPVADAVAAAARRVLAAAGADRPVLVTVADIEPSALAEGTGW
ncbi:hypothetical protein [Plantactinospora sp. KBS50]|uniref:hypothetical protein n=1 Tax=Plantactinospora sp. KBS50 TaxID=2024580 RepID=UPI000BAB1A8E|nr:hypothetical protein [Plantactinospora sp. KBS50]ASW54984.1 hypothetical protein CIK06_13470 [Plantactinospora sp. KBS50]